MEESAYESDIAEELKKHGYKAIHIEHERFPDMIIAGPNDKIGIVELKVARENEPVQRLYQPGQLVLHKAFLDAGYKVFSLVLNERTNEAYLFPSGMLFPGMLTMPIEKAKDYLGKACVVFDNFFPDIAKMLIRYVVR